MDDDKLITIAIYTYEKAQIIKSILESEGIPVMIQNVNLIQPVISSGVRVRINEKDLPHALQILEQYPLMKEGDSAEPDLKEHPKHILVPIDFSDYSMKACQIGFDFAHRIGADIMLFHAYFSPYYPGAIPLTDSINYDLNEEEALKQVQERVNQEIGCFTDTLHEKIKSGELPDVSFSYTLREGIPEDEINLFSRSYKPVLIIMGTRGKKSERTGPDR